MEFCTYFKELDLIASNEQIHTQGIVNNAYEICFYLALNAERELCMCLRLVAYSNEIKKRSHCEEELVCKVRNAD